MSPKNFDAWVKQGETKNKGDGREAQLKFAGVIPGEAEVYEEACESTGRKPREIDDYSEGD